MITKREAGETAFPDLATLDRCIREVRHARLEVERKQEERAQAEAEEREMREHPDEFFDVRAMIHEFVKQKGIEVLPPDQSRRLVCEFCNGMQMETFIEILTAADLRALADVKEKREALKAMERQAGRTEGPTSLTSNIDTRGSSDPVAVRVAVQRGIMEANKRST